jgi:hypothetical protein
MPRTYIVTGCDHCPFAVEHSRWTCAHPSGVDLDVGDECADEPLKVAPDACPLRAEAATVSLALDDEARRKATDGS